MHYIKIINIQMNLIIKSLKKNIYINLLIILCFLSFFFYNDYNHIKRYLDGYKYAKTDKIITSYFSLQPKEVYLFLPTRTLFEKSVKEYFHDSNYDQLEINYGGESNRYTFHYSYKFDDDKKTSFIKKKVDKFNKLFLKLHSDKMKAIFGLNERFFFGKNKKYQILEILDLNVDDLYTIKIDEVYFVEKLKLGQKKKILLSKMLIGNFVVSLFLSILICLIIRIIKDDFDQSKE